MTYEIIVDEQLDTQETIIPSMILQPLVENAVNHGLFHKKENGKVMVHFIYLTENSFKVSIIDDGIGIKKAKEIYIKSTKNYRSNSTEVLQERLQLLQQSNDWKIDFTIKDLADQSKKTGTEVTIIFKKTEL